MPLPFAHASLASSLPYCNALIGVEESECRYGTVYVREQGRHINAERFYHVVHEDPDRLERLQQQVRADMSHSDPQMAHTSIALINTTNNREIQSPEQLTAALRRQSPLHIAYRLQEGRPAPAKRALCAQPPLEEKVTPVAEPEPVTMTPAEQYKRTMETIKSEVSTRVAAQCAALPQIKGGFPLEAYSPVHDDVRRIAREVMTTQHDALRQLGSSDPVHLANQLSMDVAHSVCATNARMLARQPEAAIRAELGRSDVWKTLDTVLQRAKEVLRPQAVGDEAHGADSDASSNDDEPAWTTSRAPKMTLNVTTWVSGKDVMPAQDTKPVAPAAKKKTKSGSFTPYEPTEYKVELKPVGAERKPSAGDWKFEPFGAKMPAQSKVAVAQDEEFVEERKKPANVGAEWKFEPYARRKEAPAPVGDEMSSDEEFVQEREKPANVGAEWTFEPYARRKETQAPVGDEEFEAVVPEKGDDELSSDDEEFDLAESTKKTATPPKEERKFLDKWKWWKRPKNTPADAEGPAQLIVYNRRAKDGLTVWVKDANGKLVEATKAPIEYRGKGTVWLKAGQRHIWYRYAKSGEVAHEEDLNLKANRRYSVVLGMPFAMRPIHVPVPWVSAKNKPADALVRAELPSQYSASLIDMATNAQTPLVSSEYTVVTPGAKKLCVQRNGRSVTMPNSFFVHHGQASLIIGAEEDASKLRWNVNVEADATDDLYHQHAALRRTNFPASANMMFINGGTGAVTLGHAGSAKFHTADNKECTLQDENGETFIFDGKRSTRFDDNLDSEPMDVHAVMAHPHNPNMTVVLMAPSK